MSREVKIVFDGISVASDRVSAILSVTTPDNVTLQHVLNRGDSVTVTKTEPEVNSEAAEPAPEVFNARQRAWEKAGELLGSQAYPEQILALAQWLHEGEEG